MRSKDWAANCTVETRPDEAAPPLAFAFASTAVGLQTVVSFCVRNDLGRQTEGPDLRNFEDSRF